MVDEVIARALRIAAEKGLNQSELADAVGASPQDITNWKKRGMPAAKYKSVADALHIRVDELLTGVQEARPPYEVGTLPGLAHSMSHSIFDDPLQLTWEEFVQLLLLPAKFTLSLPDDANAPDFPKGMKFVWSTTRKPQFGSLVLVRGAGLHTPHARQYRQGLMPGSWIAAASNPAFASFDGGQLLEVIAVAEWRPMP
jgi:transcriptional regulator with XRE-family HTH domain